jgi:hypothetical protein
MKRPGKVRDFPSCAGCRTVLLKPSPFADKILGGSGLSNGYQERHPFHSQFSNAKFCRTSFPQTRSVPPTLCCFIIRPIFWPWRRKQYVPPSSRDSSVARNDGLQAKRSGFDYRLGKLLLFFTMSRPALRRRRPLIQWVSETVSPGVKRPRREADHSPISLLDTVLN